MKKSNILLVSTIGLAVCWTILIGWFASYAINNYLKGKDPYFARTHRQFLESSKKTFPMPVNELSVSGEGAAIITILPGNELCVLANPKFTGCAYSDLKNGKALISLKNLMEYNDPVTIKLTGIPSLSLDGFSEVSIKGLDLKEIQIHCTGAGSFILDSCRIGTLHLDFPCSRDQLDIRIDRSNSILNFIASARGSGKLRMETAGQCKNQIILSDSIKIEATYDLMKKLAAGQESAVPNK